MKASEFDIGDLVEMKGTNGPIYGQVVDVWEESEEIGVTQLKKTSDDALFLHSDEMDVQPVACVQQHIPVNCDFDLDSSHAQYAALVEAWKHVGFIPLDDETLWKHPISPVEHRDLPILSRAQEEIIKEAWGANLDHGGSWSTFFQTIEDSDNDVSGEVFARAVSISDEDEAFTRAVSRDEFVTDMHADVRYMNQRININDTKRQAEVRAFLNHLHTQYEQ